MTKRQSGPGPTVERGSAWLAGRARNAVRHTGLLATVGGTIFVGALVALVVVPREARREARTALPSEQARVDTLPLATEVTRAQREVVAAESAYARAWTAATAAAQVAVDTFPPALVARRDTLAAAAASLGRLISRAENAPLPASYRTLGQSPELRNEPRIRALLDSLADIERERDALDNLGGVDPIYIALTAQVTAIGRSIQRIGAARRSQIRRELALLQPPPTPSPPPVLAGGGQAGDTAAAGARVREARRRHGQALGALRVARARNQEIDERVARARELANVMAPPIALLAAALVLGAAGGFGISLLAEIRRPRLADPKEAERTTGKRVLAVVRAQPPAPERSRRRSDAQLPDVIDRSSDTYRLLYYRFAPAGAAVPLLTVTGDEPEVAATVATNLAVASVFEGRSTLLIDGDLHDGAVSRVLRIGSDPGLAGVLRGTVTWPEVIATTPIGRAGLLDVIPNGTWVEDEPAPDVIEEARRAVRRLASRYDVTILVASPTYVEYGAASIVPGPDVLLCARVAHTPLRRLLQTVDRLHRVGERLLGVVVWDADPPQLPTRDEVAAERRSGVDRRSASEARTGPTSRRREAQGTGV